MGTDCSCSIFLLLSFFNEIDFRHADGSPGLILDGKRLSLPMASQLYLQPNNVTEFVARYVGATNKMFRNISMYANGYLI